MVIGRLFRRPIVDSLKDDAGYLQLARSVVQHEAPVPLLGQLPLPSFLHEIRVGSEAVLTATNDGRAIFTALLPSAV